MANIPIQENDRRIQFIATASQTQFDPDFLIFNETDFTVLRTDNSVSPAVTVTLVLNTDYTVSGLAVLTGFQIVLDSVAFPTGAAAGDFFTVFGDIQIKRLTDFNVAGAFNAVTVNAELDAITQIIQELNTKLVRSLRLTDSDDVAGIDNRLPIDRAGSFLAFDAAKLPISSPGSPPATVVVSAFGATLVDDANQAAARTTLGLTGPLVQELNIDQITTNVQNTIAETVVYTFSVPGNTLGATKWLRLSLLGDWIDNDAATATLTIRVKYGATTIATLTLGGIAGANPNRAPLQLVTLLAANGAAVVQVAISTLETVATPIAGLNAGSAEASIVTKQSSHLSIAEDSTLAKTLEVTYEWDVASANVQAQKFSAALEFIGV